MQPSAQAEKATTTISCEVLSPLYSAANASAEPESCTADFFRTPDPVKVSLNFRYHRAHALLGPCT